MKSPKKLVLQQETLLMLTQPSYGSTPLRPAPIGTKTLSCVATR